MFLYTSLQFIICLAESQKFSFSRLEVKNRPTVNVKIKRSAPNARNDGFTKEPLTTLKFAGFNFGSSVPKDLTEGLIDARSYLSSFYLKSF